ncbi:unnamed protein product [Rotaria magnacalcarata]
MSSTRNYSKESRSYYSRSSSFSNDHSNSSYRRRPLSSLLIERDFSSPSLALDHFDDPHFFERRSRRFLDDFDRPLCWRFNDDWFDEPLFKSNITNNSIHVERCIPINYRKNNSSTSTTRNIPVQYLPSSANRHEKLYKKIDNNVGFTSNTFQRNNNDCFERRENRITTDDWPPKQDTPTRKRTSMTIFVRPPRIQYSDASNHQRTMSTPNYRSSNQTNYY